MALGRYRSAFISRYARRSPTLWVAVAIVASVMTGIAGPAQGMPGGLPVPEQLKPLPYKDLPLRQVAVPSSPPVVAGKPGTWPAAGEADVDLAQARAGKVRAGALPV